MTITDAFSIISSNITRHTNQRAADVNNEESSSKYEFNYRYGEHIGDKMNWNFRIIDKYENLELFSSNMKRTDKNGLHLTYHDQVIACNILLKYP